MWDMIFIYYGFINIVLFIMMGFDKWQAKRGKSRVPEIKLFAASIAGGGIGGFLGMVAWHHKIRKARFYFVFLATTFIHIYFLYQYLPVAWK